MMNNEARLNVIFSLTTTTTLFSFPQIRKNINSGWYNNRCYKCSQFQIRDTVTRPYDIKHSPAHLFIHLCVKSDNLPASYPNSYALIGQI
jgi:hypothetical protein